MALELKKKASKVGQKIYTNKTKDVSLTTVFIPTLRSRKLKGPINLFILVTVAPTDGGFAFDVT